MRLKHFCSVESCIEILSSARFLPVYPSPLAGDSGLNCFIEGKKYSMNQSFEGEGAIIYFEWDLPVRQVTINEQFPLEPNVLFNQDSWRAIIPAGTDRDNIKVVDIEIEEQDIGPEQNARLEEIKASLKTGPIYLSLGRP